MIPVGYLQSVEVGQGLLAHLDFPFAEIGTLTRIRKAKVWVSLDHTAMRYTLHRPQMGCPITYVWGMEHSKA